MELGVSTAIFFPRLYTEDAFAVIKSLGCNICEVFMNTYCEYEPEFSALFNSKRNGVSVHSVHALSNEFEPELFNRNPRVYSDAQKLFHKVLAAGKSMGAKNYTFHGPAKLKKVPYVFDYGYLSECINRLTEDASGYGVSIAYENVHWCYFSSPEYFNELKGRCPLLKATLDIKQAVLSGIPYGEYIDAMAGRIETVHICDIAHSNQTTLPGRGDIDFAELFRRLKKTGYNGPVMMEVYSKDYKDFSEVAESCEYIRRIMKKEGVL